MNYARKYRRRTRVLAALREQMETTPLYEDDGRRLVLPRGGQGYTIQDLLALSREVRRLKRLKASVHARTR